MNNPQWTQINRGHTFYIKDDEDETVALTYTQEHANLLTAAPDVLEALKLCLAIVSLQNGNLHDDTNQIQAIAQAAIAKATGQEVATHA